MREGIGRNRRSANGEPGYGNSIPRERSRGVIDQNNFRNHTISEESMAKLNVGISLSRIVRTIWSAVISVIADCTPNLVFGKS
jgi:hypothetical protein